MFHIVPSECIFRSQIRKINVSVSEATHSEHHRRLSPVTILRYAALCTMGQLARKIS